VTSPELDEWQEVYRLNADAEPPSRRPREGSTWGTLKFESERREVVSPCEFCGQEFTRTWSGRRFCRDACKAAAWREHRAAVKRTDALDDLPKIERVCLVPHCRAPFLAYRRAARFCDACRARPAHLRWQPPQRIRRVVLLPEVVDRSAELARMFPDLFLPADQPRVRRFHPGTPVLGLRSVTDDHPRPVVGDATGTPPARTSAPEPARPLICPSCESTSTTPGDPNECRACDAAWWLDELGEATPAYGRRLVVARFLEGDDAA
jgi:hypothetical protein